MLCVIIAWFHLFEEKNRVLTQLFHFKMDKNSRKLRSPHGCPCNWEILSAQMCVRLMYLQSGVHWKHFHSLSHFLLRTTRFGCFFWQQQQQNRHTPSSKRCTRKVICAEYLLPKMWVNDVSLVHTLYAQFHLINAITRLLLGLFKFQYIWNFHEFS